MQHASVIANDDLGQRGGGAIFAGRYTFPRVAPHPTRVTHSFSTLMLCTEGRTEIEQSESWRLDEGSLLLVPAGQPHRIVARQRAEAWGLGFWRSSLPADDVDALYAPFERVREGAAAVVSLPVARHTFMNSLFRELERATTRAASFAVQRSLLTLVLDEVSRAVTTQPHVAPGVVSESLRYIERHCLGPLTLTEVAAAVGRTPAYVTTALTRATGQSAVAWITAGRMAEARRLLGHSDEHVEVIGERVGYADPTHFIRMFRKTHGATPAAWRRTRTQPPYIDSATL